MTLEKGTQLHSYPDLGARSRSAILLRFARLYLESVVFGFDPQGLSTSSLTDSGIPDSCRSGVEPDTRGGVDGHMREERRCRIPKTFLNI